jgi:hypothetical protein
MCLVSAATVRSWWVPYELGFAKRAGKHLATLKVKGEVVLPEYLGNPGESERDSGMIPNAVPR